MLWSFYNHAHDYYFAFAEVQYNQNTQKLEATVIATGHDIEEYLAHIGQPISKLENANNPIDLKVLQSLMDNHFQVVNQDGKKISMRLIAVEVNTKDEALFYMISQPMEKPKELHFTFDLLMHHFPEQQNKITIFEPSGKSYLSFMPHKTKRTFRLEDN